MRRTILSLALLWSAACGEKEPVDSAQDADADGYAATEDCDDDDAAVNPGAEEACDGIDNNCNDEIDEGALITVYDDADGDGYGADETATEACEAGAGQVEAGGDCDDVDVNVNPGEATEACDDPVDRNCDGVYEYVDADGDTYPACLDCDDGDAEVYPGAEEVCDGVDNSCDGEVDEPTAADAATFYADLDGDGYGDLDNTTLACFDPPSGYVADDSDCDDDAASVNPGAEELCDGADTDCDGVIAEALVPTDYSSVQDAVDAEEPWICLEAGTYTESVEINPSATERLEGVGSGQVTLDGGGQGRTLKIDGGDGDLWLSGLTITGGDATDGYAGGLYYIGNGVGSIGLSDVVLSGNSCAAATCYGGGATFWYADQVELTDVELSGNLIDGSAYGSLNIMYMQGVTLDGVQVHDEVQANGTASTGWAGAVLIHNNSTDSTTGYPDAVVSINDVQIYDNSATSARSHYAPMTVYRSGAVDVTNSSFTGNTTDAGGFCIGAGFFSYVNVSLAMNNVEVIGNSAACGSPTYAAGLLHVGYGDSAISTSNIENSVFAGNTVSSEGISYGAAMTSWDVTATYTNVSVHGNHVSADTYYAGWLFYDDAQVTLNNVDYSGNTVSANNAARSATGFGSLNSYSSLAVTYSNLSDLGDEPYDASYLDDPEAGAGVISVDPGYTDVSDADPLNWDLTLSTSSGLIDAGDPSVTDPDGSRSDIGAHGGPGAADW